MRQKNNKDRECQAITEKKKIEKGNTQKKHLTQIDCLLSTRPLTHGINITVVSSVIVMNI